MNNLFRATCISIFGATALAGFVACSSTDNGAADNGGTADGDGGGDGNTARGDGGGGDGGGAGTDGATAGKTGNISIVQGSSVYTAFAAFGPATGSAAASTCTTTTVSGCFIVVCPVDDDAGIPNAITTPNAGAVTLTGTGAAAPIVLAYGALDDAGITGYPPFHSTGQFYSGGDTITVTGAGGADLPAFAAQTVTAPNDIVLTSPACNESGCPDLDRTTDLVLAWTGGGSGNVDVTFETISDTSAVAVSCRFAAASGTATVPTAVLMKLDKAGDADVSGLESFLPANDVQFNVGSVATTFDVVGHGAQALMTVSN